MSHLDEMGRKIARLRELGAAEELERRSEEEEGAFAEFDRDSRLFLPDGVELDGGRPPGLGDLYRLTNGAQFGDLDFFREQDFYDQKAVDYLGEPIDDRERLQIGEVGEQAILVDKASGEVIVYWYTYFKLSWDSGVVLRCGGLPELIDTVALGPRYREILGPIEKQKDPWWDADPWWAYLREVGFADAPES